MKNPFFVIGAKTQSACARTGKSTADEAVEHAKSIMRKAQASSNGGRWGVPDELYVVQVVKVVRLSNPPVEVLDASAVTETD